jgi:hypothetical protein
VSKQIVVSLILLFSLLAHQTVYADLQQQNRIFLARIMQKPPAKEDLSCLQEYPNYIPDGIIQCRRVIGCRFRPYADIYAYSTYYYY